jgi:hypothetical protein
MLLYIYRWFDMKDIIFGGSGGDMLFSQGVGGGGVISPLPLKNERFTIL